MSADLAQEKPALLGLSQLDSLFQKRGPEGKMQAATGFVLSEQASYTAVREPNASCRQKPADLRRGLPLKLRST